MGKKRIKLSDQIRRAIDGCGMTRYRLSKITGISEARFSKFMGDGSGLSMEAIDTIADTLLLNITSDLPAQPKAPKRKPR